MRSLKGQYHEEFARVWPHWKANSHINIYESLKILVIFLFRHHTNSVKLLLSVFGHGWPRWKWIYESFQILCLYLTKSLNTYYGLLSFQTFTWYHSLDVPGAFCAWVKAFNLNFSEVLTKREENPRDTSPLRDGLSAHILSVEIDSSSKQWAIHVDREKKCFYKQRSLFVTYR